jgi:formiminotetrahydrofolate cyclodeaminase
MLVKLSLEDYAARLAAATPTPGGGSAAALSGALSAALLTMVCDLTMGRERYREHEEALRAIRERALGLRKDLLVLVDRDAQAYDSVMAALRLPSGSEIEKKARSAALSRATSFATETPLATADACAALIGLAVEVARRGNVNAVSDAGAAALLAYAGLRSGVMNVRINLKGIGEEERVARLRERVRRLEVEAEKRREEALATVISGIGGR